MKNYDHLIGSNVSVRIFNSVYRTGTVVRWDNTPNGPTATVLLKETKEPLLFNENTIVSGITTKLENITLIEGNNTL